MELIVSRRTRLYWLAIRLVSAAALGLIVWGAVGCTPQLSRENLAVARNQVLAARDNYVAMFNLVWTAKEGHIDAALDDLTAEIAAKVAAGANLLEPLAAPAALPLPQLTTRPDIVLSAAPRGSALIEMISIARADIAETRRELETLRSERDIALANFDALAGTLDRVEALATGYESTRATMEALLLRLASLERKVAP